MSTTKHSEQYSAAISALLSLVNLQRSALSLPRRTLNIAKMTNQYVTKWRGDQQRKRKAENQAEDWMTKKILLTLMEELPILERAVEAERTRVEQSVARSLLALSGLSEMPSAQEGDIYLHDLDAKPYDEEALDKVSSLDFIDSILKERNFVFDHKTGKYVRENITPRPQNSFQNCATSTTSSRESNLLKSTATKKRAAQTELLHPQKIIEPTAAVIKENSASTTPSSLNSVQPTSTVTEENGTNTTPSSQKSTQPASENKLMEEICTAINAIERKRGFKSSSDGRPTRPMSAYNIFFRMEKDARLNNESDYNGRGNFALHVSEKWNKADPALKAQLDAISKRDKERYHREEMEWKENMLKEALRKQVDAISQDKGPH